MERYKNVYFSAFKASLQAKLEYRVDMVVGIVTSMLMQGAALDRKSVV